MAKATGLGKGIINIHGQSSLDSRLLSHLKSHLSISKLGNVCEMSSKGIEEPITYVTQETIDEANKDSAPVMPSATACCGDGCQNCVWLEYVYKMKFFYKHDKKQIQVALSQIPNTDIRAFVEIELRKKNQKEALS